MDVEESTNTFTSIDDVGGNSFALNNTSNKDLLLTTHSVNATNT